MSDAIIITLIICGTILIALYFENKGKNKK